MLDNALDPRLESAEATAGVVMDGTAGVVIGGTIEDAAAAFGADSDTESVFVGDETALVGTLEAGKTLLGCAKLTLLIPGGENVAAGAAIDG